MRVKKDRETRKKELVDTAEQLFVEKGYENCSVNDIVKQINVAKGTFFYYFQTKEEILDEIIHKRAEEIKSECTKMAHQFRDSKEERFLKTILCVNSVTNQQTATKIETLHHGENALMHQKSLTALIQVLTPILTEIICEENPEMDRGIIENNVMIVLVSVSVLLDKDYFTWDTKKEHKIMDRLIAVSEQLLSFREGALKKAMIQIMERREENEI